MENKNNFDFTEVNSILEVNLGTVNSAIKNELGATKLFSKGQISFPKLKNVQDQTKNVKAAVLSKEIVDKQKTDLNPLGGLGTGKEIVATEATLDLRMDYMNPAQKDNLDNHTIETDVTKGYKKTLGTASKTLQAAGSLSFLYTGSAGDLMKEIVETGNTPEILKGDPKAEAIVAKIKFAIKQYTKGKNVKQEKKNLLILKTQLREILNNKKI